MSAEKYVESQRKGQSMKSFRGTDTRKPTTPFYKSLSPVPNMDEPLYYIDDIRNTLSASANRDFDVWLTSQTVTVINDRGAVSKSDLERFLKHKE